MASSSAISFVTSHVGQLAVVAGLVGYSITKNKLTPGGIVAALVTAGVHIAHPWAMPFNLLIGFFVVGTLGTKINHAQKHSLTQSATGGVGGEGARNYAQVLANSGAASLLILWHLYTSDKDELAKGLKFGDAIPFGIAASYAAAASDTLSSELGILSQSSPVLITAPWCKVPRGTNGGVTVTGLLAGLMGSIVIAVIANFSNPFITGWEMTDIYAFVGGIVLAGLSGTLLDSLLGAVVQATVEDKSSGKVVEGANGKRVKVEQGGSRVLRGWDLLNNNGVNFAMTAGVAVAGMLAWKTYTGV